MIYKRNFYTKGLTIPLGNTVCYFKDAGYNGLMNLSTLVSDVSRTTKENPLLKPENINLCLDIFPELISDTPVEYLTVSSWRNGFSTEAPQEGLHTIADLAKILEKHGTRECPKEQADAFGLFSSSDGRRTDSSVSALYGIGLDCDGAGTWDRLKAILDKVGVGYIFYQSFGWTPAKPKWRCILGLDRPFEIRGSEDRAKWKVMYHYVRALTGTLAGLTGAGFDPRVDNVSRIWYVGTRANSEAPARKVVWAAGYSFSLEKLLIASPTATAKNINNDGEFQLSLAGVAFNLAGLFGKKLEEGKYTVKCPRDSEHSTPIGSGKPDTSTVIFSTNSYGGFKCQHTHSNPDSNLPEIGTDFGLKQALEILELKTPGLLVKARAVLETANMPNSQLFKAQEEERGAKKLAARERASARELNRAAEASMGNAELGRQAAAKTAKADRLEEIANEATEKVNTLVELLKDNLVIFERNDDLSIATRIIADWNSEFCVFDQGSFYTYTPELGIWQPKTRQELEHRVTQYQNALVRTEKGDVAPVGWNFSRISGVAKAMCAAASKPGFFADKTPAVCFKNGVLRLLETENGIEQEFVPHAAEFKHRYSIEVEYKGHVPAPAWDKFLDEVLHPDDAVLLHQFLGACLMEDATRYQRAIVLVGAGANGKTSLINTVRQMFPDEAQAALAPALWSKRFQTTRLIGKAINCCDEMPNTRIEESDVFKKIITGGTTETEYKGQNLFSFEPVAGHLFAANDLPATNDVGEGFFRRWLIVSMDKQVPAEKRDRYIGEKLKADVPGIISRCITAYMDLRKQEDYSIPESATQARNEWQEDCDHVLRFLRAYCEKGDKDDWRSVDDVHRKYKQIATTEGVPINDQVSTRALGRALSRNGYRAEHKGPAGGRGWLLRFKVLGGIGNVFRSN